ncbi:MAG: cob(I)yrinic acid a,c-diamide adenosyltransferase [Oscillospiraceae bacterium]|nr:cob(I)yrinic acid a,c-diamide adenosyltransferase [Oscillospiraceae bacterium]
MRGLVHIYCGDGKGKTTASVGLAVRAAGAGRKVLFVQFFKDGSSSELKILREIENVEVRICETHYGFIWTMDDEELAAAKRDYTRLLRDAFRSAGEGVGLLVLDEVISACVCDVVPERELLDFIACRPEGMELVLTGRDPSKSLLDVADYVTEMKKLRHPYDNGVDARKGIEF